MEAIRRPKGSGTKFAVPDFKRNKSGFVLDGQGNKIVSGYRLRGTRFVEFRKERGKVAASVLDKNYDSKKLRASSSALAELERRLDAAAGEWIYERKFSADAEYQHEIYLGKQEAQEAKRDALLDAQRLERSLSLNAAVFQYLESASIRAEYETRRGYQSLWRSRIATTLGQMNLCSIDDEILMVFQRGLAEENPVAQVFNSKEVDWVKKWVETGVEPKKTKRSQKKVSPKGAKNIVDFIRSVARFARRREPWKSTGNQFNAIIDAQLYRIITNSAKSWDPIMHQEFVALCDAAKWLGVGEYIAFMTLVRHGFRPAEARGLRWEDVDWELKRIYVNGTLKKQKGQKGERYVLDEAKTEAALDWVPMEEGALELLRTFGGKGKYVVGKCGRDSDKEFLCCDGYQKIWKEIRVAAELRSTFNPYHLKHGLVTELLLDGVPETTIILMTRHTSPATIRKAYAWINKNRLRESLAGRFKLD